MDAIGLGIAVAGIALAYGIYGAAGRIEDAVRYYVDGKR